MKFGGITGTFLTISLLALAGVDCRPVVKAQRSQHLQLPIIFIPGKGGSQIEATVDRSSLREEGLPGCAKNIDRHRVWIDLWTMFRHGLECWSENMHLQFDRETKQYSNVPGVQTWIPGWGGTDTVEYIDPSWTAWVLGNVGLYAKYLMDALAENGYERGVSVRAAPYDFRYAPHSQVFYFVKLRQLVEETWATNGHRKVVLLTHSMGGLYAAYFLARQTPAWKDRYVEALITVNTPWAGSVAAIQMQAAGYNWEIDALDRIAIRDHQRNIESTVLLLPTSTGGFWSSSDVILTTPLRNYTVDDYPDLFDDISYPDGRQKLEAIETEEYNFTDGELGVAIYCFYSNGVPTPQRLIYDSMSTFPDGEPVLEMGDGDGTVNVRSLEACRRWRDVQRHHQVNVKHYSGIGHRELLHHPALIDDVLTIA